MGYCLARQDGDKRKPPFGGERYFLLHVLGVEVIAVVGLDVLHLGGVLDRRQVSLVVLIHQDRRHKADSKQRDSSKHKYLLTEYWEPPSAVIKA